MAIKKLNDRYNLIQQLSNKKGITVYLGYDDVTGNKIIIKEITGARIRKENDFSVLRQLRHPGIPVIIDAFETKSSVYIIMEYIEGGTLRDLVKKEGPLDEIRVLNIVNELLTVLDYLHSIKTAPMIHGDIKPENILIDGKRIILIDFGSTDEEEGSSGFCAPERFAGISKSVESDLYSTGEVLHFLLTGEVKKVYSNKKETDISNDIYRIIEKSTKKITSERFRTAASMAVEIRRILKMRETGVSRGNTVKTLCITGCPEAACETALAACSTGKNVLIADLDMLAPSVNTILGVDKFEYCLQDFLTGNPIELKTRCLKIKKTNLMMLPCTVDYENYESIGSDCIPALISGADGYFDIVVLSCGNFPYDRFFMDSLIYSDAVIFPIVKGVVDIRKYNAMARFMSDRQNISRDKMFFMGVDINGSNISSMLAAGAVETSWLGSIPYSAERSTLYSSGNPYVFSMKKKIFSRCTRLLKRTGVLH